MTWTGIKTIRASRFQARKYQLDPRAMVAARNRFAASSARLDPFSNIPGPIQARTRAYQANTVAVSPAQGPCQRKPSTSRRQKARVKPRNIR